DFIKQSVQNIRAFAAGLQCWPVKRLKESPLTSLNPKTADETTYDQVNQRCRSISWQWMTSAVEGCSVTPTSAEMDDEQFGDLKKRFWNRYVYPKYEGTYFKRFPADIWAIGALCLVSPQGNQGNGLRDGFWLHDCPARTNGRSLRGIA